MTRWARSGNTQKHKKMPGDATPWRNFTQNNNKNDKYGKKQQKIESDPNSNYKGKISRKSSDCDKDQKTMEIIKNCDSALPEKFLKKQKCHEFFKSKSAKANTYCNYSNENSNIKSEKYVPDANCEDKSEVIPGKILIDKKELQEQVPAVKNKKNKGKLAKIFKNKSDKNVENPSTNTLFESKQNMYMERLRKKRAKNGILLLPAKIERKLYNIRKQLRKKGIPPTVLKEISRKERRKEELKFRKTFNPLKLCFNCRQPGHILADCPVKLGSSNQETGICFKCGAADHTSFKCPNKVQGFPFAKCFICKEQGHISRDCPSNKHGVYPKGGRCNLCGNVNHLKKDCPTLKKRKEEESAFTLHTINDVSSVDVEIKTEEKKSKHGKVKQPKVVKF